MSINLGFVEDYSRLHIAELYAEVERDRLASRAAGPSRAFRVRVAEWLYAAAARVEGRPENVLHSARA